jgi:ribosome-associated heat shock protein Hsp15
VSEPGPAIRLDKWLWQARFCKSRSLAASLISRGRVRINAVRVTKPAAALRIGDGLTIAAGGQVRVVRVVALGTRRGPAPEAQLLYADLDTGPRPGAPLEPAGQPDK